MIYELNDPSKAAALFEGFNDTSITSCLQSVMGKICVTDPADPRSAMASVGCFAFYAGEPDRELVLNKPDGYVIMVPQDDAWGTLIESCFPACKMARYAIRKDTVFDREKLEALKDALPEGYELRKIDSSLYDLCLKDGLFADCVSSFGSKERFLGIGRGFAVLKDGKIVSAASSFSRYREGIEIEVDTVREERHKGLASAACAALILSCLEEGLYPSWDAANKLSVRLAEKLGYTFSHEYWCYGVD